MNYLDWLFQKVEKKGDFMREPKEQEINKFYQDELNRLFEKMKIDYLSPPSENIKFSEEEYTQRAIQLQRDFLAQTQKIREEFAQIISLRTNISLEFHINETNQLTGLNFINTEHSF